MPFFRLVIILSDQIGYQQEARRYGRMLGIQTGYKTFQKPIIISDITKIRQQIFQVDSNFVPFPQEMKINIQQNPICQVLNL